VTARVTDIDTDLNLELLHAGVRRVEVADPVAVFDHVQVTVGVGEVVRALAVAVAEMYAADQSATGALLDALAAADSEVKNVESNDGSWDAVFHECSWEQAWDRAAADREDLTVTLLTRAHEQAGVNVNTHKLRLTVTAARSFAAELLLRVADVDAR
jgi:hypothetical protein